MSEEELIEVLRQFDEKRVEELSEKTRNIFYAIMKIADERDELEKENKILKYTISKALEFINNHTYRWKDTQFGEMVEVEEFEQGLKPIELINILKNEFENK